MGYLICSIVCSVSVSVLLKLANHFALDIRQAIFVNYLVAGSATWVLLRPELSRLQCSSAAAWTVLLLLGFGLPSMFWVLAGAVHVAGVFRPDAAMRLSLLLPLSASFTLMGETLTVGKGMGLILGFVSIAMLITRDEADVKQQSKSAVLLLALTFIGMGVIDILFKILASMQQASSSAVLFAAFVLAAIVAFFTLTWLYARGNARFRVRHAGAGVALGALNFGNIYTYIQAHRAMAQSPSLVFAAMNIGVIVLATLIGVFAFQERLGRVHGAGLAFAVVAVVALAYAA